MRYAMIVLCLAAAACGRGKPARAAGDTLTTRQRDSVIGASRIPGASGITRAMQAQDSLNAHTARTDSIQ